MNRKVYHGSTRMDLRRILPNQRDHGKPYVYAAIDPLIALLFVTNRSKFFGDFTLTFGRDPYSGGQVFLCERHAGAFQQAYGGASGKLYILNSATFLEKQTPWPEEVVSPVAVVPRKEVYLDNMQSILQERIDKGVLILHTHPDRPRFIPGDDEDYVYRAVMNHQDGKPNNGALLQRLHPEAYSTACALLNDATLRAERLERWYGMYGEARVNADYARAFPEDLCFRPDFRGKTKSPSRGPRR